MAFDKQKYIYKITNRKNCKIYIGQSNNPKQRFNAHMSKTSSSKSISLDIDKYGKESFELEILEQSDGFQDRERYWIKYYKENGFDLYNKTKGGEEPPTQRGLENKFTKYPEEKVLEVINLLSNTEHNFRKIAKITETSEYFVQRANDGTRRLENYDFDYPIRKESHFEKISKMIVDDLKNTNILQREIAEKYGVARSMVTMINIGDNRYDDGLDYPIRKEKITDIPKEIKEEIISDLKFGITVTDVAKKYGHLGTIYKLNSKINKGMI